MLNNDRRIILTLDAGGTTFTFTAMQGGREITGSFTLASNGHDLPKCIDTLKTGFRKLIDYTGENPDAISFAFPSPADYKRGVIGDLANLTAFRGGVPLGPILEEEFGVPVFINNDGNLFALGEAMEGLLPEVNRKLEEAGSPRRYNNLLGVTLGTGYGAGIVTSGELLIGDNSLGAEIWLTRDRIHPERNAEEGISIRAVRRYYAEAADIAFEQTPQPKDIFEIAMGRIEGDVEAAKTAFATLGRALGESLANTLTLIDGIAVIGGGMAAASELFMPALMAEVRTDFIKPDGGTLHRFEQKIFNVDDPVDLEAFLAQSVKMIPVPGSDRQVPYDPVPKLAVGTSRLGTSRAVALGACAVAIKALDRQ